MCGTGALFPAAMPDPLDTSTGCESQLVPPLATLLKKMSPPPASFTPVQAT